MVFVSSPNGQKTIFLPISTVSELWRQVEERFELPASCLVATSTNGKQIPYPGTAPDMLLQYGLVLGSAVNLTFRLRGGAPKKGKKGKADEEQRKPEVDENQQEIVAEATKLKTRAARQDLKERLEIEKRNSALNRLHVQNSWRKIMRLDKSMSLRRDIEILSHSHERDLDRKDAIVQMLDRDLEESEEQFQMALQDHLMQLDNLADLHDARLMQMERNFDRARTALSDEFNTEHAHLVEKHQQDVMQLSGTLTTIDAFEHERQAEAQQEHEQMREEFKNKGLDAINVLRITLDSQLEDLEHQFENAHLQYLQITDTRTTDFKKLTRKDQELMGEIDMKVKLVERLAANSKHWRIQIAQSGREHADRNQLLLAERKAIQGHFQKLKNRMGRFRDEQHKRLLQLTDAANETCLLLQEEVAQTASRILTLAELARKRENQREKVTAISACTLDHSIEAELAEVVTKQQLKVAQQQNMEVLDVSPMQAAAFDATDGRPVPRCRHLDHFWRRYNNVLLDRLYWLKEEERLRAENATLQNVLRQYLNGIIVSDDVLSRANSLIVVNGKTNVIRKKPSLHDGKVPACVEANQIVHTYELRNKV